MNYFKRILEFLSASNDSDKKYSSVSKMTNKMLLKELVDHFKDVMNDKSAGRRLLYPMSFIVPMHPDDYEETKESLPFVLPEIISQFYAEIKREKRSFPDGVNCMNTSTDWFFKFSPCSHIEANGKDIALERGKIEYTLAKLFMPGNTGDSSKPQREDGLNGVVWSMKCPLSKAEYSNINMDALLGVDILSEGTFKYPFDKKMNEDTATIEATRISQDKTFATLHWFEGSHPMAFAMKDSYIDISGNSETRKGRNICHINSDAVAKQHVQIRFNEATKSFSLAAFEKARLNSREVPLSTASNLTWVDLSKNSRLFLNDTISIEFNAKPDML